MMTYPKDLDTQIKQLEVSIEYHFKALNSCSEHFVYKPDIQSSSTEQYAQLGHLYYQKKQYLKAIRMYLKARASDPDHFQALYQLGMSHHQLKQFSEARNYFYEISERVQFKHDRHHQIDAWFRIAYAYLDEGKENGLIKAEKYILLARQAAPNHPTLKVIDAHFARQKRVMHLIQEIRQHLSDQQWRQANTALRAVKQLEPNHPDIAELEEKLHHFVSKDALTSYAGVLFQIKASFKQTQTNPEDLTDTMEFGA